MAGSSERRLTPRSTGPATASVVSPGCSTRAIIAARVYAACLRGPVNSNVRHHKDMNPLVNRPIFASIVFVACCSMHGLGGAQTTSEAEIQRGLREAADTMNRTLPMLLDSSTRLDTILVGPGRRWTYRITLLGGRDKQQTSEAFVNELKPRAIAAMCSDPALAVFLEEDVIVSRRYFRPDGTFFAEIDTRRTDCGKRTAPSRGK